MGTACFHPKRRIVQVYVQIIDTIHEEAKKINPSQNLDLYESLQEKVTRKGISKKLMDNLSSHRTKISEAINYNYRMVIQTKTLQNHYAGLIIADCIISEVYKNSSMKQLQSLNLYNQSQPQSSQGFQFSSKAKIQNQQSILRQVDMRFQQNYLRMIIYMVENQPRIYFRVLESLYSYCSLRANKVTFSEEVAQLLIKIGKYIERKVLMRKSTQCYYMLLTQLKQSFKDDYKELYKQLKRFIVLWLSKDQTEEVKLNLDRIIKTYIKRCIAKWQSNIIYEVLIDICDDKLFQTKEIQLLEITILEMAGGEDLYQQFLKGLMLYLFAYASFSGEEILNARWKLISWGVSAEELKQKFPNILNQNSKINSISSISRLIGNNQFDINQTLTYNRYSFVYVYTFNLFTLSNDTTMIQLIQTQFFKSVKFMNLRSIHAVIQIFIQQIKWTLATQNYQHIMIHMIKALLEDNNILNSEKIDTKYFIILERSYPRTIKIQLIQLVGFIISNLKYANILERNQQIAQFLYSIYDCLNSTVDSIIFKHQFYCCCVSFLKNLYQRNFKSLLLTYFQKICNFYPSIQDSISKFFILAYIYDIAEIFMSPEKTPFKIKEIKQKITPSLNVIGIKDQILKQMTSNHVLPNLSSFEVKLNLDKQQYQQNNEIFQRLFQKEETNSNIIDNKEELSDLKVIVRNGSIYQKESYDLSDDQSLQDIVEHIKQ